MKDIWIADIDYGKPALASARVVKETEKTITVDGNKSKDILGWTYLRGRLNKNRLYIFNTPTEAIDFLIREMQTYIAKREEELVKAKAEVDRLAELVEKLREDSDG